MAARSTNTMIEMLQRINRDIADAKLAMDADLPFLAELEALVQSKLRQPETQMQQAGLMPNDGQAMMMGGGAPPGMAPGAIPMGAMPQSGGLQPGPAAPNADELRRMLA